MHRWTWAWTRRPLVRVGMEVVVVVGDRRELEADAERTARASRRRLPRSNPSTARWVAVNGRSPRSGHAATSSASKPCASAHSQISGEGPSREAGGEEPELHDTRSVRAAAGASPSSTSTQRWASADRSTASVICTGPQPVDERGQAVDGGGRSEGDRSMGIRDEGVEAVLVALRMTGRQGHVGRGRGMRGAPASRPTAPTALADRPTARRAAPGRRPASRRPPRSRSAAGSCDRTRSG